MLDLVSGGRVEFGSGESSSEAELAGFQIDPFYKREAWLEGLEVAIRCMTETPFTGVDGQVRADAAPQRRAQAGAEAAPAAVGGVLAPRDDPARRREGHRLARRSRSSIPEEAVHWVADYEATLAEQCVPVGEHVNANVACVTPMMCAPTEEAAPSTAGLEGGNFFGYSLGHYYVFGDHEPGTTDVWKEFIESAPSAATPPTSRPPSSEERLGAKVAAGDTTGLRGATGTPDQIREYLLPLRGGRRRPADLRDAGRARTATSTSARRSSCSAREVLPEFKERDEAARDGQGQAPRAGHRGGDGPQGAHRSRRCPTATRSRPCPGRWSTPRATSRPRSGSSKFAESSATGDTAAFDQITQ